MTEIPSIETLVEAGRAAAADAIEIDPLAIAVIVEASLAAVLPLVAAEGRQVQAAYEIVRDERDWWKARDERAEAALREAKSAVGEVAEIIRGSYNVSSNKLVEMLDKAETEIDAALTPSPKEPT
jgi:hypothetical protein